MVLKLPALLIGAYPTGLLGSVVAVVLSAPALVLFAYGSGLIMRKHGSAAARAAARSTSTTETTMTMTKACWHSARSCIFGCR